MLCVNGPLEINVVIEQYSFPLLFDLQIGLTTSTSMLKMTAQMMTALKVAFGMKAQYGRSKVKQRMTRIPVKMPPKVVFTLLAALTAVRPKEAVTVIDWKKEPKRLLKPIVKSSWLAFREPLAGKFCDI